MIALMLDQVKEGQELYGCEDSEVAAFGLAPVISQK
jgi:hypothetical protein